MIQVVQRLSGIGDGILGLTAVCGLKVKFPFQKIVYCCPANVHPWISLFEGYDFLTSVEHNCTISFDISKSLQPELRQRGGGRTRAEWYGLCCDNVVPQNPPLKRLPNSIYPGCVVLCPLTAGWTRREWLLPNWIALERILLKRGLPVLVIAHDPRKVAQLSSPKIFGTPVEIASVLMQALAVVGVDTGLLHLCGAVKTPGIVLAGPTLGKLVFGNWPTIEAIEATSLPCYGCYGQDIPASCATTCAALSHTAPEDVAAKVLDLVERRSGSADVLADGQSRDPVTGEIRPWYTPSALSQIQEWNLSEKIVLEWGGGYSTLWWSKRCRRVITIETNPEWCQLIRAQALARGIKNITLLYRPLSTPAEMYTQLPEGDEPDIVVIDGPRRLACLKKALTLRKPIAVIFDNWQQHGGFAEKEAESLMKPYLGSSYAQPSAQVQAHPWQTAIWHLPWPES